MGKQKKELTWQERMRLIDSSYQANYGTDTTQKTADSLKVSNTALKPTVEYDENIVPLDIETELTGEKTPTKRVQQYTQPTVPTPVNPMFMQLLQEEQKKQQLYQQTENQKQLQQLIDGIEGGKKNEGVVINRRPVYDIIPENRTGQEFVAPTGEWQPTLEYQPREVQIGKLKGLQQKQDSGQPLTEEEDKMLKRLSVIQERKTLGNENRITDTAGSLTLQNIEPLISLFSGLHPATATVQGGGQLLRNIFNMDKQYNDGDAVRQGIDIALNTVGMGIQMIPKVAVISAIANNLKLFTGATGKTTGAWGIKDQKNIDVLTHYATMIPFGARVTTALIMSEQGAEGLKSALDKNMIPGLEGIREDDKMRIVEGASHALFFASLYGAGKIGRGIKNKIDNAVKTTLEEDFPQVFQTQSPLGKVENVPPQEMYKFGKFENAYQKSGYKTEQEYLNKLDPAERTQFMEGWGKYKQAGKIDFWDYVDMVEGKKPFPDIKVSQGGFNQEIKNQPKETQTILKRIGDGGLAPKQLEVVQDYLLRKGVPQDLIDQARGQITEKPKEQPKQVQTKEQVKNDNVLQLEIMQKAGIPEAEMPDYALSSVADGKLLRSYITEVKNGELTVDEAVERVKTDYEKMKTGEKEGKFIEPEQPQTVEPKNVALSTPNQAIKEIEQTGGKVVKVYHGGSGVQSLRNKFSILTPEQKQSLPSSHIGLTGLSMTTNPDIARRYSQYIGGTSEIFEATINPNAKILTVDTEGEGIDGIYTDNEINDIINKGYDAIQDISNEAESEFRVLTTNAILPYHKPGKKNYKMWSGEEDLSLETPKKVETPKQKEAWEMTREEVETKQLTDSEGAVFQIVAEKPQAANQKEIFSLYKTERGGKKPRKVVSLASVDGINKVITDYAKGEITKQPRLDVKENPKRDTIKKHYETTLEEYTQKRLTNIKNPSEEQISGNKYWAKEEHRNFIKQALSEGKPVSEEVLADYPELRPKETAKTEPNLEGKDLETFNTAKKSIDAMISKATPKDIESVQNGLGFTVAKYVRKYADPKKNQPLYKAIYQYLWDAVKNYKAPEQKTESKPGTINPRIKADDLEKLLSQKQKEMSPKEFFGYLDNVREKLVLTEHGKNDFPTVKRREVLRRFTQEATRQNPTEKDKIRKIADVAIANFIEQPGFSVVEFMTASARAVATKRLKQAGYKTTKMVEGEKTKFALKIEKPKQEATQTKPKEPELTEEQEDKILRKTEFADIINVPIKDIHIDLKRFQNRKSAYAEAIVKDIVDNFKPWSFKQITLWKDPKDGKDYVITGHSRLEGIIKRGDVDKIPSQYFPGTEAEARLYGKLEGNRENQNESLIEDVSAYKIAKESQLPKAELLRAFKTEGKINKLERLSYLDEKGEFLNNLDSEAAQSFPNIERNAGWVGELRRDYPVLTLAHENEIFDFFYRGKKENTLIRKEDFIDLVEKRISDGAFKSDQALLLDKVDNTGARGRADTREAQKQIDKLIENNKHYEALMKNADEAERDDYQAKLLRNLREIDKLKGGIGQALDSQMSLFQTSSQIFTRNFKNWFGDWENDPKNSSKVVDEDGKPLVVYHGTPNGTFDEFRENSLFTKNKQYADRYQNQGASSIQYKPIASNPKTYGVYLSIRNPFDTRTQDGRDIWGEYQAFYSPELTSHGLVDWMEGENLAEWLKENYPEYDGIILDEGSEPKSGIKALDKQYERVDENLGWRGISYMPFSPSQIKSATGNKGTFSKFDNSILAQESKPTLMAEALKYKTPEEFVENQIIKEKDFKDSHVAPSFEDSPVKGRMEKGGDFSLAEVVKGLSNQPNDYFDPKVGARYYGYDDKAGMQSYSAIRQIMDGRKKTIIAYRTVPKDASVNDLQNGDWVTFSKQYAIDHGEHRLGEGEYKIIQKEVSPNEVWWDGNDINEWGYDTGSGGGRVTQRQREKELTQIWEDAQKQPKLYQTDKAESKPFSQLPKAEQEKLTKIITDRVIGLVIPDRTVKSNVNAITELVSEVVRFHPDRADEGTMWHEGTHLGLKSSTRPSEAKAILLQMRDSQGKRLWDGKGDPFDVTNPSLKEAHEQFAEDFGDYLNDKKAFDEKYKNNPLKKRIAEVFERIKEIFRKIVNALKGEGFADAANWYRRFYEGSLKKEAEKRFREEDIKTEKDLVLAEKQQLFQITGEKGMQNYDKANNTHIVRNNLSVAKQMDEQGLSPEQIRLATGWEKGVEGKWRYEIPDENIKFLFAAKGNEYYDKKVFTDNLERIIDYPELFDAYPDMRKMEVSFVSGLDSAARYVPSKDIIEVRSGLPLVRQANSLIHEIQHAIQHREDFAKGGNTNMYEPQEMFKKQQRENISLKIDKLESKLPKPTEEWTKEHDKINGEIERLKDEKLNLSNRNVQLAAYRHLAGEVEARNVQTRLKLTPEEKKVKTLQSTEDIKREDQIIRDSYGEASMASEPDPIGLNKAEIKELREELELDKLPKPERKRMENSLNEAKLRGLKDTAMITADEVIRTKRVIDEAEHAGMVMKAKDLRDEINDIQRQVGALVDAGDSLGIRKLIARRDDLIEQMDKLTMASDIAGTGIARALSIRRLRVEGANYDFASVMQRAKTEKGGRLTEKETARLTELTTKYEQAEQQLKTLQSEYEKMLEENEKLKAQKVTEAEVRKTSVERRASVQREKIVKEREDIKAQLRGLGFRVNDVAGLSAEGTYLIGKLALNYIKEGVVDLNEVVQKVMADVPDITERDVWRGINSKDPSRQVKAERETTKKVNQIKTQARLLEKIRLAEEGIFDKPRSKPQQDVEIKRLKDTLTSLRKEAFKSELEAKKLERALQTINELQDQLANMRRSIRKKQPEPTADLKAAKEKIKELRKIMRMDDQLADLNEQLRTKEFKIKEPRPTTPTTPEIDRKAVEIYTLKKKINEEVRKLRPLTIADYGMEVMNTLRTAKASMDMSAALRQAFFPSARRPLLAMQVQAKAIEAFFSQNAYDEIQYNIENHPNHYIRQMAKLEMTDIDSSPSHREEMFASTFAEKIPIYKHGILASNRHMVATLNLIRAGVFDEFLETYPNATMNELKAWADYVNVATGRGNLGKFTAAAQNLSYVLFSPRFAISRLQLPFMILKHWNEPRVRKEMAKDYAHFGGMAMTILGLAALAGLQVGTDPEDPNFGKIIVGNTKVDIFAGIQQPTRLLLRIGKTGTNRLGWTEASKREENPLEMIYRFGSYKLAPSVTVPVELMRGKSIIGEEREPTETLVNAVIPMVYEDIGDAYKDGGISKAAWSGSLNFFGMSTNTYEKKDATTVKTKGFEPRGRMYDRRGRTSVKRDYR